MKNLKSKRLNKRMDTICDFNRGILKGSLMPTTVETDPTTATMTIVITTVTHNVGKRLM
ncbi:hypothetical protein [Mucilaginibacter aquariorum]|uniref:Uncharacterized protein n=1 Tax=Mucilaginibacter aquariorum TaxID=2967225 RepID=A0ABT1T146_9SPHI|nr:hypothetical protein [Mucilaginibacter aquariorum]MCQ6958323.1 hypothetical protein [Mucilaginibacter aquariorum]